MTQRHALSDDEISSLSCVLDPASSRRSAEALVEHYLARIAAREPEIHAWAWLDPIEIRRTARENDAQAPRSYLQGLPIGIKDVIDTADMPTAYGSPIYAGHRPRTDAACVALLRHHGAILMGKTATTEFAAVEPATTVNPHDVSRTPGGSSSGSAAAVADGMVWAALGTQTAGSIIRPASFCGCVGYKPTFGTINRAGLKPLSESTDTLGVFTRHVTDAGWLVALLAGRSELQISDTLTRPPRFALCRTECAEQAQPEAHAALDRMAAIAQAAGAEVIEYDMPPSIGDLNAAAMTILTTEARQAFTPELLTRPELVSARLRQLLGAEAPDRRAYDLAQRTATRAREAIGHLFAPDSVILTFSSAGEAPPGLASTGSPVFNHPWSLLHLPCLNLPGMTGPNGLPVGVQLVGAFRDDARLLQAGAWLEARIRDTPVA